MKLEDSSPLSWKRSRALVIIVLAAVLVTAAELGAQVGGLPAGGERRLDGVAAVVEGEPVFESEVEEQLYLFLLQSGMRPDTAMTDTLRREILDRLIDEKLIVQEAERRSVTVPEAEVDAQVDAAIADAKQRLGGDGAYQAELSREGITDAQLRERYRSEIRRQALANQMLRRQLDLELEVTPTEAEAFYKENKDEFPKRPAEYRLAVIQIPIEATPEAKAAAYKRAEEALARIKKGESFARVAQEVSEDPNTRNAGGDLGFFSRGQLDPSFEQAAFSLAPGEVSEIVETPFGYHLIRVEEVDLNKGEVHARHILILVPLGPEDQQRAEKQAETVYQEAIGGADFIMLVSQHSTYQGPSGGGGDLGFLPASEFSPEIAAVFDTLRVGGISPPLPSPKGIVIFKMLDKRPEREYELEEIRDQLPEFVKRIKLQEQYETWVSTLREKAHIEIKYQ